jgi:c(7)-type cytochrome triheme protein
VAVLLIGLAFGLVLWMVLAPHGSDFNLAQAQTSEQPKAKGKADLPCDPIFVSGITGECAGTGDPTGLAGDAERAGLAPHPPALELADLPKDRYGLIDWAKAIKMGKVKPRDSLDPNDKPVPPMNLDIVIFTKSQFQPDVIFPHFVHTLWLTCTNCHPAIFPMNAKEANKIMTMPKIASGEFCGRCHNRIAFPLSDCLRCHVKPKDEPPVDPNFKGPVNTAAEPWPRKDPLVEQALASQAGSGK